MSQLYQNALYGTALILAAAFLRRALKERFIPEARLALWAVCLFRLLTPAAPESMLSLWGLSRLFAPEKQSAPLPSGPVYVPGMSTGTPAPQPVPAISWEAVLIAVWLAVGAVLAVRYVLGWTRTRRAVSCAILLDRDDPRYAFLPKCARLREGPMEGAPLTFGALRPTVVLSPGLDGAELDCVLAHEGVHARRRDNLWHYAMASALVVFWWNPAVWWMARLLRQDIELSCDRAALKKLGEERRADYAQALVTLAVQGSGPAFCQTFGRKAAEERIISIMKFKKTSIIGVIFSLTLVLALTVAFASEPKQPDDRGDVAAVGDPVDVKVGLPTYVEEGEDDISVDRLAGEGQGELDGVPFDYKVPTFDEDGNPVAADGGIVGSHYYSYSIASPEDSAAGNTMSDIYAENGYTLDTDGNALVYDDSGSLFMTAKWGYLPCIREDCTVAGEHYHVNGDVIPFPESNASTPVFEPTLDNVPVKYPYCPVCDETRLHQHINGQTVLLPDP